MVSSSFSQLSATLAKAWLPTWRDLGFASSDARHLLVSGDGMGHPFNGYAHDCCLWASVNWFFRMYIFLDVIEWVVLWFIVRFSRKIFLRKKTNGQCSAHGHFIRLLEQSVVSFLKTIAIFRRISLGPHFQRICKNYREVMLPPAHRCLGGLLVTALLVMVAGQGVHKRWALSLLGRLWLGLFFQVWV